MLIASRIVATALLAFSIAIGWQAFASSMLGYNSILVLALLAAWAAAWFGDDVADLINFGPDGIIRGFGLCFLAVMGFVVAAAHWQWFH